MFEQHAAEILGSVGVARTVRRDRRRREDAVESHAELRSERARLARSRRRRNDV